MIVFYVLYTEEQQVWRTNLKYTKTIVFFLIICIICSAAAFGQEEEPPEEEETYIPTYDLGDQLFSISAGLFIPLFFHNPLQETEEEEAIMKTNLSLGGIGGLEWGAFLGSNVSLGFQLAGMFAVSPLERVIGMIPITAKLSYYFRFFPFELPIFLGAGVNFLTFDEYLYFGPILKPGAAFYWNFHPEWSLGLQFQYWWVPEFYTEESLREDSRFGNFLEITFSALYHFSE